MVVILAATNACTITRTLGSHLAAVDGNLFHARAVAIAATDAGGILAATLAVGLDLAAVDVEFAGLIVLVAANGSLVVMRLYGNEFAHRSHRLALGVDGERGIGIDADALLCRQRTAVFQYQVHVTADDDALAVGER